MFQLDLRSRMPIYEQLVEKLKELIMNEILKPNEKLPSVRELAQELAINPNTIQKAYRELESQGYSYSVPGKGSFVMPLEKESKILKLEKIKQEIEKPITEALFLGMSKKELIEFIDEIERKLERGRQQ